MHPSGPQRVESILVFLPHWLGDAVMATPAIRALRRTWPEARLTVAGRAATCAVLADLPHIDHRLELPHRPALGEFPQLRRALRAVQPDLAVVLPHGFRPALLAWLSGAPARVGIARGGRQLLLTRALPRQKQQGRPVPRYTALEHLDVVALAGAQADGHGLELAADPADRAAVEALLAPNRPVVGIAPGAAFGPSKRWLPERFAAVADDLTERYGAQCLLMTGPGEEETRDAVLAAARHPLIEYHGGRPSIGLLKAAISKVDLLIGNDSGPRHIAIAFGRPVLCIMGSTSPAYTHSPWERGEVIRIDVDCGPCQRPHCVTDHRCMTGIDVARVTAAAAPWLEAARTSIGHNNDTPRPGAASGE